MKCYGFRFIATVHMIDGSVETIEYYNEIG